MALSPADFYAFSQATGSPVPEDPESRARIAPQVADWRRNQLKSPETKQADNSGLLNALGITAAVGGGAALLAGALGRRGGVRMGNAKQAARQAAQQVEVTDFGNVYTAAGRPAPSRPAPTPTPTAAAPQRPTGSRQGGIKFADLSQITGTEPRGLLRGRQPGGEITTVPGRGALTSLEITEVPVVDITEAAGQPRLPGGKDFIAGYFQKTGTPAGYLTEARRQVPADSQIVAVQTEKPTSLVDRQQAIQSLVPDQAFNALDAAEDQMTGRVKQQLQRNEDLDMSQIDLLEEIAEYNRIQGMEQDEPINQVAAQLPDGIPVDQAEKTVGAFAKKQMMQVRMTQLRDQLAQEGYRGLRLEKELTARTNIKQASELYASTGDPAVLQLASSTPSLPLTVKPKTNLQLGQSKTSYVGEDVPTGTYYEPFKQRESESGNLVQADIYYTNKLSNLAAKLEGAPQYIDNPDYVNFIEQTNMAMSAMRQGDETARKIFARNKNLIDTGRTPAPKIENPEYSMLQRQIGYAEQSRGEVRVKQDALELQAQRFPMVQKVVSTGEGGRLFAEVDPATGELIPETVEVRTGRPALSGGVISQTSTGRAIRGRVGAEGTVAGATPGIFEPAAVLTESTFKPESARYRGETGRGAYEAADAGKGLEYEAQPVLWNPNIHSPEQRTPEGFVYSEEAMLPPTEVGLRGKSFSTRPSVSPAAALESVDVSEQLRRLQRSSRPEEAQTFLEKIMQERKISALGSSMPLRPVQQTKNPANPGYARYSPQGYEVSSRGDKRYSAMYATLPTGQTIEQAYQSAKGTGKGQPAKDPNFDYYGTYKGLWDQYFDANPESLNEIARLSKGKVLTDQFASTVNNQARAIHDILTERGLR